MKKIVYKIISITLSTILISTALTSFAMANNEDDLLTDETTVEDKSYYAERPSETISETSEDNDISENEYEEENLLDF